jgi:hypothetical protein
MYHMIYQCYLIATVLLAALQSHIINQVATRKGSGGGWRVAHQCTALSTEQHTHTAHPSRRNSQRNVIQCHFIYFCAFN